MYEITTRTLAPYKSICYIVCQWPDGTSTRASGMIVGMNDVLTAGHVVYDAYRGGQATRITIAPGADVKPTLDQPFGSFSDVAVINSRVANWDSNGDGLLLDSESQYDLALLGLTTAIGNVTGWLATSATATDFNGLMIGYPARGTGLMEEAVFADASTRYGVFDIDSGLGSGASGGPLLKTDSTGTYVVGVLSSGNTSNTISTYAGLFGPGNWEWLTRGMAANDNAMTGTEAPAPLTPATDDYASSTSTTGILTAGTASSGTLETVTDNDWFRISVSTGSYRFEARGADSSDGTLSDPVITLYGTTGNVLRTDDDSGAGLNALLTYTFTTAGTYYVGVSSPTGAYGASGTYKVQAYSLSPATSAPTIYTGTSGNDTLNGTAADDTFRALEGNDIINGLGGTDTAAYTGTRAGYRMFNTGSSVTVTDGLAGRDGIDSLVNMERVTFSDMTVNLEIGAKSKAIAASQLKTLEELYVAFFNRVPDADGLAYWIDQVRGGQSLQGIAETFYAAAQVYPTQTGYATTMSNGDFVNIIYRNVLGRSDGADPGGLDYWTGALTGGTQSRGQLVTTILASAHTFKGDAVYGYVADLLDNKAAVSQKFAVEMGLNFLTPETSISQGMAIAAAVTPTSTATAISLIGVTDGFSTLG